jgi:hypothetical protein
MTALYELTAAYKQLENLTDGDISEEEFFRAVDLIDGELRDKAQQIGFLIGNLDATAKAIKEAEEKMANRRKSLENRAKAIKAYILRNMQSANIHKIECAGFFVIGRQKNPPSVVVDDEKAIPIAYWRQPETPPPCPDKKAILDDMKQGVIVDGCHIEQSERLVIK